jgi:hypothetical protein
MGFGDMLHLDDCCVPRSFVQWVADNVSTNEEVIHIGSKSIELTPQSVHDSLGIPFGGIPIDSDEENGKAAFLAIIGLIEVPSIRLFGKKKYLAKMFFMMVSFVAVSCMCVWAHSFVQIPTQRLVQSIWDL